MTKPPDGKILSSRWGRILRRWAPVLGLTALAAALRLLSLSHVPPGLYRDEAFNGLDALRVLSGEHPIYFAANRGREPLFIYFIAATVRLFGRSPGALRLAAAVCGTLTVPATYLMARTWFNQRVGLLSAAIIAITYWHVQLSRVGFRAIVLPLVFALLLWVGGRAFRTRRRSTWLFAGILYGITFYTYVAARFTPLVLIGFALYAVWAGYARRLWPAAACFAIGAVTALLPLGVFTLNNWDIVMGRPGQVSVFNPLINEGDLLGTLGRQLLRTIGMFLVHGDTIPRHNLPGRPVFDPLVGAAAVLGAALAFSRARKRDAASALTLIWVGVMLGPTWMAEDAPHFLRAVGVLPLLAALPALGLEAIRTALHRRAQGLWGSVLLCALLAFSLGSTARDYFFHFAGNLDVAYAFETAASSMAAEINRFIGTGWDGSGIIVPDHRLRPRRHVYVDERLWQSWEGLSFLVEEQGALTTFSPGTAPVLSPTDEALLLLWPYEDLQPYLTGLPHPTRVEVDTGPLTRGDLEKFAYPAYAAFYLEPIEPQPHAPIAQFGKSIELVDYQIRVAGRMWQVRLAWRAKVRPDISYTASVYLCEMPCQPTQPMAQHDVQLGGEHYPTEMWRPGDIVVGLHTLDLPAVEVDAPALAVGVYSWPSLRRLPVTRHSQPLPHDTLILPVDDGDIGTD